MNEDKDTIVSNFDRLCFAFGDSDAVVPADPNDEAVSYFEIQEYSKTLAYQLYWRFRPDYVLVDCQRIPSAEAVATLACMRIGRPFVPVSCQDQHRPGRLTAVVDHLRKHGKRSYERPSVVAVTVCENDLDPILSVFQQADVHQILYLDPSGGLREQIQVPDSLPADANSMFHDDLMVMFTSGTTGGKPKAVVASHGATLRRIKWFKETFPSSPRVPRKTALTFVDGVTELWSTLLDESSRLVSFPAATLMAEGLAAVLQSEPTQLLILPSQIGQLLMLPKCSSLKRLIVSGEQLSRTSLGAFLRAYPQTQVINLYGQTETTGDVLCAVLTDMPTLDVAQNDVVAVGKPIGDTTIAITDQNEFVVRGSQLSNGYLSQEAKPFSEFHTGDIGFAKDGIYYVRGRIDDVVKIHGVWTCPTEIETAFCRSYGVKEALACFVDGQSYVICPDEEASVQFSREDMRECGLPWNLVPKAVYHHSIPRSGSGAQKANRKEAADIVRRILGSGDTADKLAVSKNSTDSLESILCHSLSMSHEFLDVNKSFVDLGGDSSKAITALYLLRQCFPKAARLSALDILLSNTIGEIKQALEGEVRPSKRPRLVAATSMQSFAPEVISISNSHSYVQFRACIDSKPLIIDDTIYSACQGGVIAKVSTQGEIVSCRSLQGWMIQADLVASKNSIFVCGYKRDTNAGVIVSISHDLSEEFWRKKFDMPIKVTPLSYGGYLWLSLGTASATEIRCIDLETGECLGFNSRLPKRSLTRPVMINEQLCYGCSSWEGGIFLVSKEGRVQHHLQGEIGPVTGRDMVSFRGKLILGDSYGAIHTINIQNMTCQTVWLSSSPLTTPLIRSDGVLVVASNNGKLFAIKGTERLWECESGTSIIGRPILARDNSTFVMTTAGFLCRIDSIGEMKDKQKVSDGEVWGDIEYSQLKGGREIVIFGARDSRLHIVSR